MAYEIKPNTGYLFKAKERATDKHPEYTGTINIEGREYWLAGWVNEAKSGQKYFALKVKAKDDKPAPKKDTARHFDDMDSEVPF